MSRPPDFFIGRVFVPAGRREDVAAALSAIVQEQIQILMNQGNQQGNGRTGTGGA